MSYIQIRQSRIHTHTHTHIIYQAHTRTHAQSHTLAYGLHVYVNVLLYSYGVASVSRIDKIIGLFCKRAVYKGLYSAKETCNLIDPTNRSHPINTKICIYLTHTHTHAYTRMHTYEQSHTARQSSFMICTCISTISCALTYKHRYEFYIFVHMHTYTHACTHTLTHTARPSSVMICIYI